MPETSYISSVTTAYATAYKSVEELLADTKAAVAARRARDQALMVATLSILTGGVVGAVAEGLVKRLPAVERAASSPQAMQVVQEDAVLYKVFKDTTKDLVKRGADVVSDLGLEQLKREA